MKMFRNPEIRRDFIIYLLLLSLFLCISFSINKRILVLTLIMGILFISVYLISSYLRYKKISSLASDIDKMLHGDYQINLDRYVEGELSLLQTEIYKMTVRLREQQSRLLEEKLYLADSIADISHQIRTPLTSINLLVSFLSEPDIDPERRESLIRELYSLLSRIESLITVLLKISKLDAGTIQFKTENTSLKSLIDKAVIPLEVPIELREQKLTVNCDGDFCGDILWTCEAIVNIAKNCMEHTQNGGEIKISARESALYSEIIIEDNGPGIDSFDLPHIFERFYKGRNTNKDSFGIGLALSRMIIVSQNGTIKARNKREGGAQFIIHFYKGTV